jgi:surface polysaccharide O-acyltransferase-like enzyme
MAEPFMYSLAIATVFFLFRFLEMKFSVDEDKKSLKFVAKETIVVYLASVLGIYLYAQFDTNNMIGRKADVKNTMAFVDNPSF